jgi:hypothetical protein
MYDFGAHAGGGGGGATRSRNVEAWELEGGGAGQLDGADWQS